MINTTLCYIENDGRYLMLHRNKKNADPNEGKWIGIGGKFEENESPEQCMHREVMEETGLRVTNWKYRGVVTFVSDTWEGEYMHLFTAHTQETEFNNCNEGELKWIPKKDVLSLNIWAGDAVFLKLIQNDNEDFFSLKLTYKGETLSSAVLNGKEISF